MGSDWGKIDGAEQPGLNPNIGILLAVISVGREGENKKGGWEWNVTEPLDQLQTWVIFILVIMVSAVSSTFAITSYGNCLYTHNTHCADHWKRVCSEYEGCAKERGMVGGCECSLTCEFLHCRQIMNVCMRERESINVPSINRSHQCELFLITFPSLYLSLGKYLKSGSFDFDQKWL